MRAYSNPWRKLRLAVSYMVVASVIVASQGGVATATSGSVFFSEYVEGSGNNQALELYNATAASVELSTYTIEIYADGANLFSPTYTVSLIGTLGSGDTVVVVRAGSSLPGEFQAGSLIFDGNDAIVLRDGTAIVDVIGQPGLDPVTEWGTGDVSTQDNTLRRIASVCDGRTDPVNTFDPSLEWTGFALDTFDGLGSHSSDCLAPPPPPAPSDPLINEFVANHAGSDTNEFVEVSGDASTDYSVFTVLALEGDSSKGVIDGVFPVGSTDASGYWTTGFMSNGLENGTQSLLLVEGFTGTAGDDLDTDDDGVLDVMPWTRVVDDVAVNDGGAGDQTYSSVVLGTVFSGGSFAPGGASRIPDSTDADAVTDWLPNDFSGEGFSGFSGTPVDGEAVNTPGAVNVAATTPPADPAVLVI
ncbi:Alkaline phosphatase, partial [hydrothermal vent metagenome]